MNHVDVARDVAKEAMRHTGLTADEQTIVLMAADMWNKFMSLEWPTDDDRREVCAAVHIIQDKVMAAPAMLAMKKYLESARYPSSSSE